MANLNRVLLMGNLTRDPELRYLPSGRPVCTFTLAVNTFFTDKTGQRKEEATFVRISVWGKAGENCAQYLAKGRSAFVEGRLKTNSWEGEDGQKRSSLEVVADNVQFLGARAPGKGAPGPSPGGGSEQFPDADAPMADDDIPF